jgi:hypothetical protein
LRASYLVYFETTVEALLHRYEPLGRYHGQRGTKREHQGLLRQYFARGSTEPSIQPADYLDYDAMQLIRRPCKTLG